MSRRAVLLLAALLAGVVVLGVRAAAWAEREESHLSGWYLWMETDEHAAVEAAARLRAGNWLDVPAYRPGFLWQARYGTPAEWDAAVPRTVAYQGPAYPYLLAAAAAPRGGPAGVAAPPEVLLKAAPTAARPPA